MAKNKKKTATDESIYDILKPWDWPLPFHDIATLDIYLNQLIGENINYSAEQRRNFIDLLRSSFSLSYHEKERIFSVYNELSDFQLTELEKVFVEEKGKFIALQKEHPDDIDKLFARTELEWASLLNPEHGILSFFSNYVYAEKDSIPMKNLLGMQKHIQHFLLQRDKYKENTVFSLYILENCKKIPREQKSRIVNNGMYSLVHGGETKSHDKLINHKIGKYIKKIPKGRNSENPSFLTFCSYSYPYDLFGIGSDGDKHYKKIFGLYRNSGKASDLSSWMSYYLVCLNKYKLAANASEISISRYNKKRTLDSDRFVSIVSNWSKGSGDDSANHNLLRNLTRYFLVTDTTSRLSNESRHVGMRFFIVGEYFKKLLEPMKEWRPDKITTNLASTIVISYFAEDHHFSKDRAIISYVENKADLTEKFLFRHAFSRNPREGELYGLAEAFKQCESKVSLLFYALMIKSISLDRAILENDKDYIKSTIAKNYERVVLGKGWNLDGELDFIKM